MNDYEKAVWLPTFCYSFQGLWKSLYVRRSTCDRLMWPRQMSISITRMMTPASSLIYELVFSRTCTAKAEARITTKCKLDTQDWPLCLLPAAFTVFRVFSRNQKNNLESFEHLKESESSVSQNLMHVAGEPHLW